MSYYALHVMLMNIGQQHRAERLKGIGQGVDVNCAGQHSENITVNTEDDGEHFGSNLGSECSQIRGNLSHWQSRAKPRF